MPPPDVDATYETRRFAPPAGCALLRILPLCRPIAQRYFAVMAAPPGGLDPKRPPLVGRLIGW